MANTKITSKVIADDAILTANITDANVTTAKIAADAITGAKIADDVALGGNPTTTTQSAGNNTTRVATTAFVSTAVSNLVDSSPSALNTLNELAAALGDDANFSTTVTNSIAAKLPLAGGTMTGNIAHASDFTLDVGGDIILDADGGDIKFADAGTTVLEIKHESSSIDFSLNTTNDDFKFKGSDDGSTITALTLDMSAAGAATFNDKVIADSFETTAGGTFTTASGNDLNIVYPDARSLFIKEGSTTHVTVDNTGKVGIGTTSPDEAQLLVQSTTEIATGGSYNTFGNLHVSTDTQGQNNGGTISMGGLGRTSGPTEYFRFAQISGRAESASNGSPDGYMAFEVTSGVTNLSTERARITSIGDFVVATTSTVGSFYNGISGIGFGYSSGGYGAFVRAGTAQPLYVSTNGTGSGGFIEFSQNGAQRGVISYDGSNMVYGGTSDYRLKKNVTPIENALTKISALNPINFDWIESGENHDGFLAHEAQTVIPYAVTGVKDEVATDDNSPEEKANGEPLYQMMEYGKLTPLLVKAIQEQQTIIDDLKARIETLEG